MLILDVHDINEIRYFDIDAKTMDKFEQNIKPYGFNLTRCSSAKEVVTGSDIVTTITADKKIKLLSQKIC